MIEENYVLNLGEIIKQIIKKWKVLLILFLVGVLVGGGVVFATGRVYTTQDTADEIADNLSSKELKEAKNVLTSSRELSNQLTNYSKMANSKVYKDLTVSSGKKVTLMYNISNSQNAHDIAYALSKQYDSSALKTKVSNVLGYNVTQDIIDTIIEVSVNNVGKTTSNSASNNSQNSYFEINNGNSANFSITIYAKNYDQAKSLKSLYQSETSSLNNQLKKKFSSYSLKLITDQTTSLSSSDIYDVKSIIVNKTQELNSKYNDLQSNLNDNQKAYINAVFNEAAGKKTKKVDKKNIIVYCLGVAILLLFLYIIYIICKYLRSHLLHTSDELQDRFNINTIMVTNIDDSNDVDKLKKEVIYTTDVDQNCAFVSTILNFKDINVHDCFKTEVVFNYLPSTKEDYKNMEHLRDIYLIEQINISNIDSIREAIKYYKMKGINIKGVFILR